MCLCGTFSPKVINPKGLNLMNAATRELLSRQSSEQLRLGQQRAERAAEIHQAGARFYMAEKCAKRAADSAAILTERG